jgi:hypothetical protein
MSNTMIPKIVCSLDSSAFWSITSTLSFNEESPSGTSHPQRNSHGDTVSRYWCSQKIWLPNMDAASVTDSSGAPSSTKRENNRQIGNTNCRPPSFPDGDTKGLRCHKLREIVPPVNWRLQLYAPPANSMLTSIVANRDRSIRRRVDCLSRRLSKK